jgi:Phage conserved hypothetical protein BR0599
VTFWDNEKSLDSGEPYELHEFRLGETSTYWRYADAPADISYGGNVFTSLYWIKGDAIESGVNAIKSRTTVRSNWNNPFAWQYAVCAPDDVIHYTRYKGHGSDVVRIFTGEVIGVTFRQDNRKGEGRRAEITIDPSTAAMQQIGLVQHYSRVCQVEIYTSLCGANRDDFKETGTLDDISGNVLTSTIFGAHDDDYWTGGDVIINTHRRKIVSHSGNTITIWPGIYGLTVGDAFDAAPGCDHLWASCDVKFNNGDNYKGQPNIPDDNPTSAWGFL